jgi:hypothetical protein
MPCEQLGPRVSGRRSEVREQRRGIRRRNRLQASEVRGRKSNAPHRKSAFGDDECIDHGDGGVVRFLERLAEDGLFDAIQERLPKFGERELGLDAAHIDGSDRFLNSARDRDFGQRDDTSPALVLSEGGPRSRREDREGEQPTSVTRDVHPEFLGLRLTVVALVRA